MLLQQDDGALSLQPWEGAAGVPLPGLPTGTRLSRTASDATGVLARDAGGGAWLVEASQRRVLRLEGDALALGPTSALLAVYGPDGSLDGLATQARPAASDAPLGLPVVRAAPPQVGRSDVQLLPMGEEVVLSVSGQGRRAEHLPVTVLAADGTVRDLLPWAAGVQPAPGAPTRLLDVTGGAPRDRAVTTTPLHGGPSTVLRAEPPVVATPTGVALDDDRLVVVDDSEVRGGLAEHPLVDLAIRRVLATDARALPVGTCGVPWVPTCRLVVAGGGATAYGAQDGVRVVRADEPSLRVEAAFDPASTDGSYVAGSRGSLTRLTDAATVPALDQQSLVTVADGVTYAVRRGFPDQLLTRDLRTGATALVGLPTGSTGCDPDRLRPVDVAGSALLVSGTCGGPVLVDLTGARSPQVRADLTGLGNGFGVALHDGHLAWTDAAGSAHPVADGVAAVAAGSTAPTLAWIAGGLVHVARVPVPPSAPAPHPTELLAPPAAPAITLRPGDSQLGVGWDAPAPAQRVDSWTLTLTPGGTTRTVPADQPRSWTFWPTPNGRPHSVAVTATNRAGTSSATSGTATPLGPPPPVTQLKAGAEPDTGWTTGTWSYADDGSHRSRATSFHVNVHGTTTSVPASARSARLRVLDSGPGTVVVQVHGATGWSTTGIPFSSPLPDSSAPTVALTPQPAALLSGSTTLRWTGSDDRRVVSYDVRTRTARAGETLGDWTYPSALQGRYGTSLPVTGLPAGATTCWSVRSRDGGGNVSAWPPSTCTTVASDERVLSAGTGWTRSTGSTYYRSTLLTASRPGARATLSGLRAGTVSLLVTRCPACGKVAVYDDGTLLANLDTRARATTKHRRLLRVPSTGTRTGTLTVKVLSGQVRLDGLVLRASS